MTDYVLGIDIGTSSTKGVLVDQYGNIAASDSQKHEVSNPRPGWYEQDADDIWWSSVVHLAQKLAGDHQIVGVAVTGLGPCALLTNQDGRPLRPAILYGVDTRATTEIEFLRQELGDEAIVGRCGSYLSSQAIGPKLMWVMNNEPDVWSEARRFFSASSYAVHRLTGAYTLDHHTASQCDPMYDLASESWIEDWAEVCAPGIQLPELFWPGEIVGSITPHAAAETGLQPGTPVIAGTVDAWAEAESIGSKQAGDLMLMYGTTMFLILQTQDVVRHPALWTTVGLAQGSRCLAGGMATSGAISNWFAKMTKQTHDHLSKQAREVPAGSRGLLVLPYFAGERTPIADPDARGAILGLGLNHGPAEIYRAILESTAFAIRHNLEAFEAAGAQIERISAVGGGTTGGAWVQIVSDVTGRAQELPVTTIGASYGGARLVAEATGFCDPSVAWAKADSMVEPNPAHAERYSEMYGLYRDLYPATSDISHALAAIGVDDA